MLIDTILLSVSVGIILVLFISVNIWSDKSRLMIKDSDCNQTRMWKGEICIDVYSLSLTVLFPDLCKQDKRWPLFFFFKCRGENGIVYVRSLRTLVWPWMSRTLIIAYAPNYLLSQIICNWQWFRRIRSCICIGFPYPYTYGLDIHGHSNVLSDKLSQYQNIFALI